MLQDKKKILFIDSWQLIIFCEEKGFVSLDLIVLLGYLSVKCVVQGNNIVFFFKCGSIRKSDYIIS